MARIKHTVSQPYLINHIIKARDRSAFNEKFYDRQRELKKYPIKVQLAAATNSGRVDKASMKPIREDEKVIQAKIRKEGKEFEQATRTENFPRIKKELNDLARVYAQVGLISFGYNFPNKKSLQASMRKKENDDIKKTYQQTKKIGQRPKKDQAPVPQQQQQQQEPEQQQQFQQENDDDYQMDDYQQEPVVVMKPPTATLQEQFAKRREAAAQEATAKPAEAKSQTSKSAVLFKPKPAEQPESLRQLLNPGVPKRPGSVAISKAKSKPKTKRIIMNMVPSLMKQRRR